MSAYVVTGQHAGKVEKKRQFGYGLLKPITAIFYKWKDKDAKGVAIEGTGGEREYKDWLKLDERKRGQKWEFAVDKSVINPKFENPTVRGVMLGFQEWQDITVPSIIEMVGEAEKSVSIFAERAASESWYVEYELVPNGEKSQDGTKDYTGFKWLRMTQSLDEVKQWNAQRFPKKEVEIPADVIEMRDNTWSSKIVQKADDPVAKFTTLMNGNEDAAPFLEQLNAWAKTQVQTELA